jgi:hypothetical protein
MTVAEQVSAKELGPLRGNYWRIIDGDTKGELTALPAHVTTPEAALEALQAIRAELDDPTRELVSNSRAQRDALLRESDWTQLPDAPVDQKRWAIYRQQLRDMDFDKPEWPEQPGNGMTPEDTLRIEKHLDRAARTILFDGKNKS